MAVVYDTTKGSFKDDQQKEKQNNTNSSGMMSKELSSLSDAGPENHTLAYITPEEEKLLAKATGKETIMTAYGIPTYETEMTLEEMEAKLTRDKIDELLSQAINTAQADTESRKNITGDTPQQTDEKLTEATENQINSLYSELIKNEYERISKIQSDRMFYGVGDKIKSGVDKAKGFFTKPKEGESSMEKIASGTATMDDKYSLYPAMNIMGYEVPGPRALLQEHIVKPLMNYLSKNKEEFNPNKDYHLNKFLLKKQQEMQSTEDYIPPQP